jgi:hypothetical protein
VSEHAIGMIDGFVLGFLSATLMFVILYSCWCYDLHRRRRQGSRR